MNDTAGHDSIVTLDHITKVFPGVRALDNVSLNIHRGEVHALVGENGAGKTTLMHILGGVANPTSGRIYFDGEEVRFTSAHDAQRRGIRVVYQELSIFPNLSVAENIFANCQPVSEIGLVDQRELNRRACDMLSLFSENINPDIPAGQLPISKRQVLEILKALTFSPRVILLDEPTSSLTSTETGILFKTIQQLKAHGISFVFISHHLPEVFEIADRVTILRDGVVQGTFPVSECTEESLIRAMVGRSLGDMFASRKEFTGKHIPLLDVEELTRHRGFNKINFTIHAGEIVGFAGLVGAGRTEVAQVIFGLKRPDSGQVKVNGVPVTIRSPRDAIQNGIGYLTEDRKLQGLFLSLSVHENLISPDLTRFTSWMGIINEKSVNSFARDVVERFSISTPSVDHSVYNLSGGNQQKVLLGTWMGINPKVLIADEPTKGIDVGAKQEIYHYLNDLKSNGTAVMLISSDLNEILGLSDRICIMRGGQIVKMLNIREATEELIISYALGAGEVVT